MNWVNSVFSSDESPKTGSIRNSIRKNSLFNSVSGLTSNKPTVCNDLIDSVLNYIKNNYVHKFDPFIYDKQVHTDISNYGTLFITKSTISGASSIERCGNFVIKSQTSQSTGDKITLCGNIKLSYLRAEFKLDAKFGKPGHRISFKDKSVFLWIEEIIIHIEIALNMKKQNVKISDLKIVAINNLEGKSGGIKWPFNKLIDALLTRRINVWKNNCQDDIEKLRIIINEIFNQYFNDIFTHINISEFIDIS